MPEFDVSTQTKIATIRRLRANGVNLDVYEMVKFNWPSPDGAVYYATLPLDELAVPPPVSPIETVIVPEDTPAWFMPVSLDSTIGDEEFEIKFWDSAGTIADLINTHGEGVKVELYYWIPGPTDDPVELLLPIFHGHLRVEDEADAVELTVKVVQGFRTADANIPHRAHWQECQNIFGGLFTTQAEIDEHAGCPYNRQIVGGMTGNLNGAVPYTSCPRRTLQQCTDRLGNARYHLSHQSVSSVVINNQTSGPRLLSTSRGNETNLKEPVRVIMGKRRCFDMKVVAYRRDLNNNDPDRGWFAALYEVCEGPIERISIAVISVAGVHQNASALHYAHIFGEMGQGAIDPALSTHTYSGTALIRYVFGWVDPRTVDPDEAVASAMIEGLNNIRVYTDAVTYTEEYTTNRAWHIARILCDKRWGYGMDYDRLDIDSFIECAEWVDDWVRYTDSDGTQWDHIRGESHVELIERKVQQQIEDMCIGGRLSRPFLFNGKIHIVPLREATSGELAAAPEFTDEGNYRNIIWEDGRSTLKRSRKSDLDLINRIECTFDDATQDYLEQPAPPVEDIDAQLAAGRVIGDFTKKINPKKYSLLGVTSKSHAVKLSWGLLDLGPFDEGGLQNNLTLKFRVWYVDALDLHPFKIIKVTSSQITRYGFTYFRIMKIQRRNDLQVELEVQAYNETFMATFETTISPGTPPAPPNPPTPPCVLTFGTVTYSEGTLTIPIPPC